MMTDVQRELDGALRILSVIPVSGDSVEYMAAAKQRLRRAFDLCNQNSQEGDGEDG